MSVVWWEGLKGQGFLNFCAVGKERNVFNPVLSLKGEENPQRNWTRNMWKGR